MRSKTGRPFYKKQRSIKQFDNEFDRFEKSTTDWSKYHKPDDHLENANK